MNHELINKAPDELRQIISGHKWQHVHIGRSTACTLRLQSPEGKGSYLKIASVGHGLTREYKVISWLNGKLPVPEVIYYGQTTEHDYLLISELPGANACDERFRSDIPQVVRILAQGMKMIHSLDIKDCPFDQTLDQKLEEARYRVANGLVDETDFEDEWLHRSAQDILAELMSDRPESEDLVFTHGDYCLPNIIIHENRLSGFIDWGSGGISDRYQDLSLAARSLSHNWGNQWVPLLLSEYGLKDTDERKMEYYRLMDELF